MLLFEIVIYQIDNDKSKWRKYNEKNIILSAALLFIIGAVNSYSEVKGVRKTMGAEKSYVKEWDKKFPKSEKVDHQKGF